MSLLGNNVFANPTTPLWSGAGGGSNDPNPTFESVTAQDLTLWNPGNIYFYNDASGTAFSVMGIGNTPFSASNVVIQKQNGQGATVALGAVQVCGASNDIASADLVVLDADGLTRQNTAGGTTTYATFASNALDLSNVSSINGVPYFNAPGTQFDYSNYPGGTPLAEDPVWTVLNSRQFTPPVNGKLYVETLGTFIGTVQGGTAVMSLSINGTDLTETPTRTQAYDSNINFTNTYMYQFPVLANVVYDISSIANCSALPPASADVDVTSSRMFLLFSPN
jgi:hypothetical protein